MTTFLQACPWDGSAGRQTLAEVPPSPIEGGRDLQPVMMRPHSDFRAFTTCVWEDVRAGTGAWGCLKAFWILHLRL